MESEYEAGWQAGKAHAEQEAFGHRNTGVRRTPEDMSKAFEIVTEPQFWCRAKLFHVLVAAHEKGVLQEVLDEMEIKDSEQVRILDHLRKYWPR